MKYVHIQTLDNVKIAILPVNTTIELVTAATMAFKHGDEMALMDLSAILHGWLVIEEERTALNNLIDMMLDFT
jgi:hypothetical protein